MKKLAFLPRTLAAAGLLLAAAPSCTQQQYPTPTRSLDRPSDVALFCVDYEVPKESCLPAIDPARDPEGYLTAFCGGTSYRDATPSATVLAMSECDDARRRRRRDAYYAPVRQAAQLTGRYPDAPCCAPGETSCDAVVPACARQVIGALVANTARGELAVADTQAQQPGLSTSGRLQNLHGGKPGYGFLPVGLLPEHVRAFSPDGAAAADGSVRAPDAWAVTSNTGSCDLSVVGIQAIARMTARPASCDDSGATCPSQDCGPAADGSGNSCPQRVQPWVQDGGSRVLLGSRPSWIEVAPWVRSARRQAVISFPTCGVVTVVDLDSQGSAPAGQILEAVRFDKTGTAKVLTAAELAALRCPADCGGDGTGSLMPDVTQIPPGGVARQTVYPSTFALDSESQRLIVGDAQGDSLTLIDLEVTTETGPHLLGTPRKLTLDFEPLTDALRGGQRGLDGIRIGPRSAAGKFAYAIARDSSVRVVDLDREIECETNPDPRYLMSQAGGALRVLPDELNDSNLRRLSCLPVGQTPRNPLAPGPGIFLPTPTSLGLRFTSVDTTSGLPLPNDNLPRDVGFVRSTAPACSSTVPGECPFSPLATEDYWILASPSLWVGDFAWVLGGNGSLTGIQVGDACPMPSYRACMPMAAAARRLDLLHTRSQALPTPTNLPSLAQALMVTPLDRLGNVPRTYSRFDDRGDLTAGPRTDADVAGLPAFTALAGTAVVSYFTALNTEAGLATERRRLTLPAPAPYYYLPVDPVCDVAIYDQAMSFASPDGVLPAEPTRRPVTMMSFPDPRRIVNELWSLQWEGALAGFALDNSKLGRLLSDGTLIDLNGLYCSRGVEEADKVWLTGCRTDSDCAYGTQCRREQNQGDDTPGLCLSKPQADECRAISQRLLVDTGNDTVWAATWRRNYRITRAEQQVDVPYPILNTNPPQSGHDTLDRLTLDEISEPEFELERKACAPADLGKACSDAVVAIVGKTPEVAAKAVLTCRGTGYDAAKKLTASCVLECQSNADCGIGYVCAHSRYESDEGMSGLSEAQQKPRCMRAPLIAEKTKIRDTSSKDSGWHPMTAQEALGVLKACFPNQNRYEIHAGDAFLVRGSKTGAPTLLRRNTSGVCERPQKGDPAFAQSRLLEPRLRLGPRDSLEATDARRCSGDFAGWISHRVPGLDAAVQTPSCQGVLAQNRSGAAPSTVDTLRVVRGQEFFPQPPDPERERQGPQLGRPRRGWQWDPMCASGQQPMDPRCLSDIRKTIDPWLDRETELLSLLPLDDARNQCVLTGRYKSQSGDIRSDEDYPLSGAAQISCTGFCRFPGDHTEIAGVRRIHYENASGSLVMRVPRDPNFRWLEPDPANPGRQVEVRPNPPPWAIPPEGYVLNYNVYGGLSPYVQVAQTAQRDSSSGVLAQGLKAAVSGPNSTMFLVDEGRTGSASGLRGQIMRTVGSVIDPYFLLR